MIKLLRKLTNGQEGQSLPIVLALLVFGGLTIAPSLSYTATSLNNSRIVEESINGAYAADAGVEDVIWSLRNGVPPSTQLSDKVNQMAVTMQTDNVGTYTLYLGELIEPGGHNDFLAIEAGLIWDEGASAYKYTITVIWQPEDPTDVIHLEEVGARLPLGYSYQPGSAALFAENLATGEPSDTVDTFGAHMLNWELGTPKPSVSENNTVESQIFYIAGAGEPEGHYAWIVANREDVGEVGTIAGGYYRITATAVRPENNETTATVVADTMIGDNMTYILSWQILN